MLVKVDIANIITKMHTFALFLLKKRNFSKIKYKICLKSLMNSIYAFKTYSV